MKRIRFNLKLHDETIQTIEDLQSRYGLSYDMNEIYTLYKDGTLMKWLKQQGEESFSFLKAIDEMPADLTEKEEKDYLIQHLFNMEQKVQIFQEHIELVTKKFPRNGRCETFSDLIQLKTVVQRLSDQYVSPNSQVFSLFFDQFVMPRLANDPIIVFLMYWDERIRPFFNKSHQQQLKQSISELIEGDYGIIVTYDETSSTPIILESQEVQVIPLQVVRGWIQSIDGKQHSKSIIYPELEVYQGLIVTPSVIFEKVKGSYMRLGDVDK